MRRGAYLKQLDLDLRKWATLGLIDSSRIDELKANSGPAERHYSLSGILFLLGAILLACAIVIFIGANWQSLPRIARLGILVFLMWSAYGMAIYLANQARGAFSDAMLLLGCALFGATIMLIGQMYHINAGWPNGVLLWACGTYAVAMLAPSRSASVLAILLFCIWSAGVSFAQDWVIHWAFLPALAAMIVLARAQKFTGLVHLIVLAFLAWCVANGAVLADDLPDGEFPFFIALMTTLGLGTWLGGTIATRLGALFGSLIAGYGLFFLTVAAFFIQLAEDDPIDRMALAFLMYGFGGAIAVLTATAAALRLIAIWDALIAAALMIAVIMNCTMGDDWSVLINYLHGGLYLAFVVWLLTYGLRTQRNFAVNLAFVAFGAQVIYLYFVIFGTMLQQSALFAVGGVLFLIAAFVLERVRREVVRPAAEGGT